MAQRPHRRRRGRIPDLTPPTREKTPPPPPASKDPGADTSADTKLVNALESNPEFFKDPLLGTDLGKCTIEKYIGEGKTSIVYRAHYQPLKRTVAVKVLQSEMTKVPAVVRVFQQEGRAVAAIDHENVLKIYDVGEDRGYHYMVLELLKGKNLLDLIEHAPEKRLPAEEALRYVQQAARGLAAAHRKNLVHRDIKPQNLVVEPDGTLKIVDFGLAAEAEGAFSGGRLGTPHYMSPEQCRGENASAKSDIYSLGITLFHMVVGHPPFAGKQTKEEIIAEHLKGHRLEPERFRKDLPRSVGDLVRRMTRMEPAARPAATELFEQIEKLKAEEAAGRAGEPRAARPARAARRRAGAPSAAIAAGGLALVGLVVFLLASGGDDAPAAATPKEAAAPPVTPKAPKPEPPPAVPKTLDEELRQLFAEAEREEQGKNWSEAHRIYLQIMRKAPPESPWHTRAKAAAATVAEVIDNAGRARPERAYVTPAQSQQALAEFEKRLEEWRAMLKAFRAVEVRQAMEAFVPRTRPESPERERIEAEIRRAGYVEALLEMAAARAHTLSAGKERWARYESGASEDLVVTGADAQGVSLVDASVEGAEPTLRPWANLPTRTIIRLLDAIRNEQSPRENLCLGYYCLLVGHDLAETYLENALQLDRSASMRAEVEALRK